MTNLKSQCTKHHNYTYSKDFALAVVINDAWYNILLLESMCIAEIAFVILRI